MSVVLAELRALRADVEADVEMERVDAHLGRGVHGYLGALARLVADGDRDPSRALNEGRSAAGFLRAVPRLPTPRPWSDRCRA
ncbi:hypothetical protein AFCDBAGC_3719 [Methylobacterium cerastii]|uniref:Uncharacterized protein n=1 Tax=Methylobacterium cerastii TaxID=932741 RepID=A0ABQ4QL03_9HYPH|nr:hypothetical protein [Methylobacterium cerastii]GJD45842.1 hypothetical protein AFCDBAGC_3719 [Methylobacterium cerastii]